MRLCDTISIDRAFIYVVFYGDGSVGFYECKSGNKYSFALNNADMNVLNNLKIYKRISLKLKPQFL
jgi:hypothetical protein